MVEFGFWQQMSVTPSDPPSQCLRTLDMVALLACDISENCQLYVLHAMPKESAHTSLKPKLLPAPQILDMCVWLDLLSILIQMASSLSPWILQKASCGAPGDITTTNNCQTELKNYKYELNDGLEYDALLAILTSCKYTWYSLHLFISIGLREGLNMEHSIFFGDSSSTQ